MNRVTGPAASRRAIPLRSSSAVRTMSTRESGSSTQSTGTSWMRSPAPSAQPQRSLGAGAPSRHSQDSHRNFRDDVPMHADAKAASAGKVLVVDDESNIADVLSIALRFNNYEVAPAADGQGALQAVSDFRPDLVLLDVMLPDFDGFEVARRMREAADDTPILFLPARHTTEDK